MKIALSLMIALTLIGQFAMSATCTAILLNGQNVAFTEGNRSLTVNGEVKKDWYFVTDSRATGPGWLVVEKKGIEPSMKTSMQHGLEVGYNESVVATNAICK